MSRIGNSPVSIPSGVTVNIDGRKVTAKGKLGELSLDLVDDVDVVMENEALSVKPKNNSKRARSMWGTTASRISNIVKGVDEGFSVELEINGVGYRAAVKGKQLNLQLGYSHDIDFPIPDGIKIACAKPTSVTISGADKQLVGQIAANIRSFRKPEPYKGKGVKYLDETIFRKEGKKK